MEKRYEKGGDNMAMPKDTIYSEMNKAWETYLEALENSLDTLEKDIEEAKDMAGVCTDEWCEAVEHVIDDLNNALFSISEPRWSDKDSSKRIKTLKRRVYDIYVNYKGVYAGAA
jgi:molecular chaperone GrpE (heat shock protein)